MNQQYVARTREPVSKPPLPMEKALYDNSRCIGDRVLQLTLALCCIAFSGVSVRSNEVSMRDVSVVIRHVDYEFAVTQEASGLRRMDWDEFKSRPRTIIDKQYKGIRLENDLLKVTLVPKRGRVHSMVNKVTGNELL